MRIWVDENIPLGKEAFSAHGEVVTFAGRALTAKAIAQADALIIRSITKVNAGLLEGTPVRFVGTATIGTDHVDQAYLSARGIGFAFAPGCNANSVGEYVTAALTHLEIQKQFTLAGKTLGIIGYGHVGKQVERKAMALGMRVLLSDPPMREAALAAMKTAASAADRDAAAATVARLEADLHTLLDRCDMLTLHVPLTKAAPHRTLQLANADFFARLTRPTVLLNTCRGEVIDDTALQAALDAGKIRHLILDVFTGEPDIDQSLCARADLITPHIAGYSLQGKLNGTAQIAQAFRRFFGFTDAWQPTFPVPARPFSDYSELGSDSAFLHHCVHSAYPILADDKCLRESFRGDGAGLAFDRQRRDYPVRHEFPAYTVRGLPPEKRELGARLQALGFQVA
jgi:erythronate-4-phosphate dehydrogenase